MMIDGDEHLDADPGCHCEPTLCAFCWVDGRSQYVHNQAVYGPSMLYKCDGCGRSWDSDPVESHREIMAMHERLKTRGFDATVEQIVAAISGREAGRG